MLHLSPKRTSWRTTRTKGTLWDSGRTNAKCCPWEGSTSTADQAGEQLCRNGPPWGPSGQLCALAARTAASCLDRNATFGLWEGIIPHFSALVRPYLDAASSFEATNARKRLTNWCEFSRDLQAVWELEHLPGEEKLKELGLFSLKQTQLQRATNSPPVPMGRLPRR